MHWYVLGAGSIGGLWASHLALAGFPVTLLLKDRQTADRFAKTGLRFESGDAIERPAADAVVVSDFDGPIEWLLVTTKSYATLAALESLEARLTSNTRILLLQNGVGIQQQVAENFPQCEIIAAITTDGAFRREAFHVVFAGRGWTRFGAVDQVSDGSVDELCHCLSLTGLETLWVDDIWQPIWHKAAINCCINALTATRRCRNGELLQSAEAMTTIRGLVGEIEAVLAAAGLGYSFPHLYNEVVEVIQMTADNYSSMYQDVMRGSETEIDYLNGQICETGQALGIDTPLNRGLLHAVRAQRRD